MHIDKCMPKGVYIHKGRDKRVHVIDMYVCIYKGVYTFNFGAELWGETWTRGLEWEQR